MADYIYTYTAAELQAHHDTIAAGGGGAVNGMFYENAIHVEESYTITAGKNAMSAGEIIIDNGVTVTVPNGSTWSIV